MTGLRLSLVEQPKFSLDLSSILPDTIGGKSLDAVRRTSLAQGRRKILLGDLFEVAKISEDTLEFHGVTKELSRIGSGMTQGVIRIVGNPGDEIGAFMTGGEIHLHGNAGDYLGSGMRGGIIHVSGSSGDFTAGALPHTSLGMRDGIICIGKSVGMRAGERMRRGLLVANGNAGPYCGSNMIAGTIVVTGCTGPGIGFGMSRGTILLKREPPQMLVTFNDCGTFQLTFPTLLLSQLRRINRTAFRRLRSIKRFRRLTGDIACGGQGELLVADQ
ncbi:MAG TPA: formylmethanofuran dehydrogenase subunit C [Gammaproteobacteria bacterium]|nr:formylmethanofuran dehydrogenase subunit C [Gammaproteobacteria bacterium]|tara:strand:+ start:46 stop:864 length:819 start_codon:yes stop_codon:yes gene_type:complete